MIRSLSLRLRPGLRYDGPAAYVDGLGHPPLRAGYYALSADGKSLLHPAVRLCAVTSEDGSHHYEVVRKADPHQRPFPGRIVPPARVVELEFEGEGEAEVGVGDPVEPGTVCGACGTPCDELVGERDDVRVFRCRNCGQQQEFARE